MFKQVRKLERLIGAVALTATMIMPGAAFAVVNETKGANFSNTFMGTYGDGQTSDKLSVYSLDDAEFTFYTSEAAAKSGDETGIAKTVDGENAIITMDWEGGEDAASGNILELELGDYWVVETVVPEGCEIDPAYTRANPRKITVAAGSTADNPDVFAAADPVPTFTLPKLKKSIEGNAGTSKLEGMVVQVDYYDSIDITEDNPDTDYLFATWYFKTNANGEIDFNTDTPLTALDGPEYVSDKLFSRDENGTAVRVWPRGTYIFTEVEPPAGLELNEDNVDIITFEEPGDDEDLSPIEFYDDAITGGIYLEKQDMDTEGTLGQGDATLEGATFSVYNYGDEALTMDGREYKSLKQPGFNRVTDAICTMETEIGRNSAIFDDDDEHLYAATDIDLPSGTYIVIENAPGEGYNVSNRAYVVTIGLDSEDWIGDGELKWVSSRTDNGFVISDTEPGSGSTAG